LEEERKEHLQALEFARLRAEEETRKAEEERKIREENERQRLLRMAEEEKGILTLMYLLK
jgi:hypothetical protein